MLIQNQAHSLALWFPQQKAESIMHGKSQHRKIWVSSYFFDAIASNFWLGPHLKEKKTLGSSDVMSQLCWFALTSTSAHYNSAKTNAKILTSLFFVSPLFCTAKAEAAAETKSAEVAAMATEANFEAVASAKRAQGKGTGVSDSAPWNCKCPNVPKLWTNSKYIKADRLEPQSDLCCTK